MRTHPRYAGGIVVSLLFALFSTSPAAAADKWIEVKSPHFTVTSNASSKDAAKVAWELEQIRSAIGALWTWARVDLNKPLVVFALKDENSLKALAPVYWERKNDVHPNGCWVGGYDQSFLALRTDVRSEDNRDLNPYQDAYFSYVSLITDQSLPRNLPLWFQRGFAGVVSNTVVRDQKLFLGPPIPWHLRSLNQRSRLTIAQLMAVNRDSPEYRTADGLARFDAESWAFVHFLMFADNGARWSKLDQFVALVGQGTEPSAAFREAFGATENLEEPFAVYINRSIYSFRQFNVDVSVKPEGFAVRPLGTDEEESRRALFHVAMRRPTEARAAIDAARKAGPAADSWVAEALLLDQAEKVDEARAAYAHATDAGTTDEYAYYRLASLMWQGTVDKPTLTKVAGLLEKAIALNNRDANAYAMLAQARASLGTDDADGMAMRAISLAPSNAFVHYAAARVLRSERKYDDALRQAEAASTLATDEGMRQRAAELADAIRRAKGGG